MRLLLSLLTQVLHIGLMLAVAPTLAGGIMWLDARLAGLSGPPVLLPWRDLRRLCRKTPSVVENTCIVSRLAPAVSLGMTVSAAALVPSFTLGMVLSPLADVLVIAALLTVARVADTLAALDSGAAMPGLAAQRGSAQAVLAEPALMLSMVALAMMAGTFNLNLIISQQRDGLLQPAAAATVVLTALVALVRVDAGVSDREALLTGSGAQLAMARMTGWLRRLIWVGLTVGLFLPMGIANADAGPEGWFIGLVAWFCKLGIFVIFLFAFQALAGPLQHRSLRSLLGIAALLALLAISMILAGTGLS